MSDHPPISLGGDSTRLTRRLKAALEVTLFLEAQSKSNVMLLDQYELVPDKGFGHQ